MVELSVDLHFPLEPLNSIFRGCHLREHDFDCDLGIVFLPAGHVDRPKAASPEFFFCNESWNFEQPRFFFSAEDEGKEILRRNLGEFAGLDASVHCGLGRSFLNGHHDVSLSDGDFVPVLQFHHRILDPGALLRRFAGFATAPFLPVNIGAVQATEVAEGGLGRAGLQDEMVPGDLSVVRESGVAIRHPPKEECVVLSERKDLSLGGAFNDGEGDLGRHTIFLRFRRESVNAPMRRFRSWTLGEIVFPAEIASETALPVKKVARRSFRRFHRLILFFDLVPLVHEMPKCLAMGRGGAK